MERERIILMENKTVLEILKTNNNERALPLIQEELLSRENRDLTSLSASEQYKIIIDKVGTHANAVIPDPTASPEQLVNPKKENRLSQQQVQPIISKNELFGKLLRSKITQKPLSIKVGVDPTAGQIHVGHGITLRMMRRFQQMGHNIQFIIGDATAMVGDSTDRMSARQPLSKQQIDENMKNYTEQASRIINLDPNNPNIEIYHNSEWLNKSMMEWLPILQNISASRSMDRKDFKNRLSKGGSVSLGELMYSTFMAYDSVHLASDIEIGGLDQYLNFLQTRDLMSRHNLEPETIVTVDLLPGTTGSTNTEGRLQKMSKSLGNYIALDEDPISMYTKIMGSPDSLMPIWFRELTEISSEELKVLMSKIASKDINPHNYQDLNLDPVGVKRLLARTIVASLNSNDINVAINAEKGSMELVGKDSKLKPENAKEVKIENNISFFELLELIGKNDSRLSSRSKIRKLINNHGLSYLDNQDEIENYKEITIESLDKIVQDDTYIKIGKKSVFKISTRNIS